MVIGLCARTSNFGFLQCFLELSRLSSLRQNRVRQNNSGSMFTLPGLAPWGAVCAVTTVFELLTLWTAL